MPLKRLTITGQGSYMGLPKADQRSAEIASPADAPGSIVYNAYEQEDGSLARVSVEAGSRRMVELQVHQDC